MLRAVWYVLVNVAWSTLPESRHMQNDARDLKIKQYSCFLVKILKHAQFH